MEEINNIWQLVALLGTTFLTLFFKYLLVDKPKSKKNEDEKKELESEIESLKDKEQDFEIVAIKSDIAEIKETNNWIVEKMKSKDDLEKLYRKVKEKIDQTLLISECENEELKHLIFNSQQSFRILINDVLTGDFELSVNDFLTDATHLLKNAKQKIDREKLKIFAPETFLEELEAFVIKPNLQNLTLHYSELKELKNGVRRKKFSEVSLKFIYSIVSETITRYSNYSNSKTA